MISFRHQGAKARNVFGRITVLKKSVKSFFIETAYITGGCWTSLLFPILYIIFFFTEYAYIRHGASQDSRFIISPYNIVFAVPATIF
jgi:hypothetical protein